MLLGEGALHVPHKRVDGGKLCFVLEGLPDQIHDVGKAQDMRTVWEKRLKIAKGCFAVGGIVGAECYNVIEVDAIGGQGVDDGLRQCNCCAGRHEDTVKDVRLSLKAYINDKEMKIMLKLKYRLG